MSTANPLEVALYMTVWFTALGVGLAFVLWFLGTILMEVWRGCTS